MFAVEPSKYSIITSETPQTSARSKTTKKNYIKLVTPSFHHSSFIRPVTEIMLLSSKDQYKKLILPLSEIVTQHGIENAQQNQERRTKQFGTGTKKVQNSLQPKQKKYRNMSRRIEDSTDEQYGWRTREESPIHRLMAVSRLGKEPF